MRREGADTPSSFPAAPATGPGGTPADLAEVSPARPARGPAGPFSSDRSAPAARRCGPERPGQPRPCALGAALGDGVVGHAAGMRVGRSARAWPRTPGPVRSCRLSLTEPSFTERRPPEGAVGPDRPSQRYEPQPCTDDDPLPERRTSLPRTTNAPAPGRRRPCPRRRTRRTSPSHHEARGGRPSTGRVDRGRIPDPVVRRARTPAGRRIRRPRRRRRPRPQGTTGRPPPAWAAPGTARRRSRWWPPSRGRTHR